MRAHVLITGSTVLAWALGGCGGGPQAAPESGRDIELVQPDVEPVPVSAIEAGRAPEPEARLVRRQAPAPDSAADPAPVLPAALADSLEPLAASAAGSAPAHAAALPDEAPPEIIRAPLPPAPEGGSGGGPWLDGPGDGAGRGPVIIIRGGRGGIDDDCDLHRPAVRRPGVAINRVAPEPGGGGVLGRPAGFRGGRSR
jgi:hypothetical protein